jgi:uncharacterized protein
LIVSSYFLDTSALVKLYVREPGSEAMVELATADEGHALALLSVTSIEFRSALRRRERSGDVSAEDATHVLERFATHVENRFERISVSDPLVDRALALVDRHALRAYDAMQLAGCLQWKSSGILDDAVFVCSDKALLAAAVAEGVKTFDPTAGKKVR